METEVINIRVDAETAKTLRSLPEEDRRKLETLQTFGRYKTDIIADVKRRLGVKR